MANDSKPTDRLRLGIAGCGGMTQLAIAPIIRYLGNAQLCAVVDPDKAKAEFISDSYGPCEVYTDYDRMLGQADIDAVLICSPVYVHGQQVVAAAAAGKHVFCEKPMAPTIAECDRMIQACRSNKVSLMVGLMKRFNPCFQEAARMVQEGHLGDVFKVVANWEFYSGHHPDNWRRSGRTLGGVFQDHGSHSIDLATWWLGDVEGVSGQFSIISPRSSVEDSAHCILNHGSGAVSVHQHCSMSHKSDMESYSIYGTKATLDICFAGGSWTSNDPFKMKLHKRGKTEQSIDVLGLDPSNHSLDGRLRSYNSYYRELEHFCNCLICGDEPLVNGEHGRRITEVINAVYLSSHRRQYVKLPLAESFDLEKVFSQAGGSGKK
ncbi:MAG: Gfo/Idh/MocA family oxidoreductase [Planctomycetota bacterium]|nr:Gfo/Idh/MocA family oxidoreductase [Planctomycetota bacterium]